MEIISQSFGHTPVWVYALFVFLVLRGLKSLKPREVSLRSLAMIPALFLIAGIATLAWRFGFTVSVYAAWLIAVAVGAGVGWLLLYRKEILVDRSRGVLFRPADYTVMPLILCAFAVKYAFGAIAVINPGLVQQPGFGVLEGVVYGVFSGIFVGKFANYTRRYLRAPPVGRRAF